MSNARRTTCMRCDINCDPETSPILFDLLCFNCVKTICSFDPTRLHYLDEMDHQLHCEISYKIEVQFKDTSKLPFYESQLVFQASEILAEAKRPADEESVVGPDEEAVGPAD